MSSGQLRPADSIAVELPCKCYSVSIRRIIVSSMLNQASGSDCRNELQHTLFEPSAREPRKPCTLCQPLSVHISLEQAGLVW